MVIPDTIYVSKTNIVDFSNFLGKALLCSTECNCTYEEATDVGMKGDTKVYLSSTVKTFLQLVQATLSSRPFFEADFTK